MTTVILGMRFFRCPLTKSSLKRLIFLGNIPQAFPGSTSLSLRCKSLAIRFLTRRDLERAVPL